VGIHPELHHLGAIAAVPVTAVAIRTSKARATANAGHTGEAAAAIRTIREGLIEAALYRVAGIRSAGVCVFADNRCALASCDGALVQSRTGIEVIAGHPHRGRPFGLREGRQALEAGVFCADLSRESALSFDQAIERFYLVLAAADQAEVLGADEPVIASWGTDAAATVSTTLLARTIRVARCSLVAQALSAAPANGTGTA